MDNRINKLFNKKKAGVLSVYITAGFPKLDDTAVLCAALQSSGADIIEIGIPFSDPVADGPTIQHSSEAALKNGMTLKLIFEQLAEVRKTVDLPILLMGYFNPVLQYGVESFCRSCAQTGVDGCIIPDLPMELYLSQYKEIFDKYNLHNVFLVTPQSSEQRIRFIDENSNSFIYAVSSAAVTGSALQKDDARKEYLKKLAHMNLKNPLLVGFGVSTKEDFQEICSLHQGAIIGSAFIKAISAAPDTAKAAAQFISGIVE